MNDVLMGLSSYPLMETAFVAAVVLVLIDYLFPVDYPAFIGYLCFAVGVFFALPWTWLPSLAGAAVTFGLLLLLHRVWFTRFLTNAPGRAASA